MILIRLTRPKPRTDPVLSRKTIRPQFLLLTNVQIPSQSLSLAHTQLTDLTFWIGPRGPSVDSSPLAPLLPVPPPAGSSRACAAAEPATASSECAA